MFNILPWERPGDIAIRRGSSPFSSLQNEMNRLFDDFFENSRSTSLLPPTLSERSLATPLVDIVENAKGFKVEAELPGLDEDDVEVTVNDNYLTIKGQKEESKEDKNDNYIRRERYYGTTQRTIALPETADADKVKASFKKGVLHIDIPKKAEAIKPTRKIEVKKAA